MIHDEPYMHVNGTSSSYIVKMVFNRAETLKQEATISVDATNITLTWTRTNTPNNYTIHIMWEAEV